MRLRKGDKVLKFTGSTRTLTVFCLLNPNTLADLDPQDPARTLTGGLLLQLEQAHHLDPQDPARTLTQEEWTYSAMKKFRSTGSRKDPDPRYDELFEPWII